MAIGGFIGGVIDPEKITGPHIGDGQQQSATDGAPISWVMGTAWVAGTIVQVGPRKEVKIQDSGKGGPEVSHYEAHQDFAILICESCSLRDSTVGSILMVEQDGKIVYDVRPESTMLDDSAKWKANVDFLFGDENQMPHPTLEALTGVGNTPAYRGSALAVFKNFNRSSVGDRIPTYRFLVSSAGAASIPAQSTWRYISGLDLDDATDYSDPDFNDSAWDVGRAPFGNLEGDLSDVGLHATEFNPALSRTIATTWPHVTVGWIRNTVNIPPDTDLRLFGWFDNDYELYIGGNSVSTGSGGFGYGGTDTTIPAGSFPTGSQVIAVRCQDDTSEFPGNVSYFDFSLSATSSDTLYLGEIVRRICVRGGIGTTDVDTTELDTTEVLGYVVGKQYTAVEALGPLVSCYFAYGSEYDAKIHFNFYGADATVTVNDADLLEGNDANEGNVTANLRNNSTEFPLRIIGTYYDPAQNYMPVQVSQVRRARDVIAIGDRTFDIPVVMEGDTAMQAVDKAMKVAYATLEGTLEYSVPFGGTEDNYLAMCPGDPLLFRGKRWVIDEMIMSNGYVKLTTRYDRQSAYTSDVQAIPGNPPIPPVSPYSGPTTLYAMNLPSLRPQDTYGLYLAAAPTNGQASWHGCVVQISYDNQASWQSAVQIVEASVLGTFVNDGDSGGEPFTVDVIGDLFTVTDDQLAANANAFAHIDASDESDIGQFKTAAELSSGDYEITDVTRGLLGTTETSIAADDRFTLLQSVYFLPIDPAFAGKTLYLRAVGFNEVAEEQPIISIVYNPDTTIIYDGGTVTP